MFFQTYGDGALIQWAGMLAALVGLIVLNEIARRTKLGGILLLFVLPILVTIYLIAIQFIDFNSLPSFAQDTVTEMNSWFHYAKLYAADIGCVGFLMLKYKWGIGAKEWFKPWPFIIVAINILIAVASDFESAANGFAAGGMAGGWWFSSEDVWLYGGWWNIVNGIAGLINIFCMTGWWGIYSSKKNKDMLWPDMTIWFILAYDLWNFEYTYCNLPTHTWYCGVALLLAPTFANALWNKGGWIQNRANTLAVWCMFAQTVPLFQITEPFSVLPSLYKGAIENGITAFDMTKISSVAELEAAGITANPTAQGVVAILALAMNVICLAVIIKKAIELKKNPYKNEIFVGTKDYEEAMARRA